MPSRFRLPGVYRLKFKDGSEYIGSSRHIPGRVSNLIGMMKRGASKSAKLQQAYEKEGAPSSEVLLICRPCDLLIYEQLAIDAFHPALQCKYAIPGRLWKGRKHKDTTKEKMRAAHTGSFHSEETREKIKRALEGKKKSQGHCENISKAKRGRPWSNLQRKIHKERCIRRPSQRNG